MTSVTVNRFDGGLADDKYLGVAGQFALAKGFDILTQPSRLTPVRKNLDDATVQQGIAHIIMGSDGLIYGLGTDDALNPGSSYPRLFYKSSPSAAWATRNNYASTISAVDYSLFVEYQARYIFCLRAGNLVRFDRTNVLAANGSYQTLSWTTAAQGVVHPKDDILYIPYDNKIATLNDTTWNATALTGLPSDCKITAIAPWGNYLAIATVKITGAGLPAGSGQTRSTVYLWDRNTSIVVLDESIDWGTGILQVLNVLDGYLIGVSVTGAGSAYVLDRDSIQIRVYGGGTPQLIKTIPSQANGSGQGATIGQRVSFVYKGRLYFSAFIWTDVANSMSISGLWSVGKNRFGQYAVNIEHPSAPSAQGEATLVSAMIAGDVLAGVYSAPGAPFVSSTSSDKAVAYADTAYLESLVNPNMPETDKGKNKQLMAFAVHCAPLTSTGQIVAKYRVDGGSWLTIFTKTASSPDTNLTVCEAVREQSAQFVKGRNYEFRLESIGGAEITGFSYKYQVLPTNI